MSLWGVIDFAPTLIKFHLHQLGLDVNTTKGLALYLQSDFAKSRGEIRISFKGQQIAGELEKKNGLISGSSLPSFIEVLRAVALKINDGFNIPEALNYCLVEKCESVKKSV